MSRILVTGTGAVSPAGWGLPALAKAVASGQRVATSMIEREAETGEIIKSEVAKVPDLPDRSLLPRSPRLRRSSPVSRFAAAAVLEALGRERFDAIVQGELRAGVVCTMMNGCVNYSNRFYREVLDDPSTASPIIFPETVYNAPSSHISAMLQSSAPNDTLVGDGAEWFEGLELAAEWLDRGDCDLCLLLTSEEVDWLSAEAMGYYSSSMLPAEGAAALVLEKSGDGPRLLAVPDSANYAWFPSRTEAMAEVWNDLSPADDGHTVWSDGCMGVPRYDVPEEKIPWSGPRFSTRKVIGESLGASAGLQTVAALEWMRSNHADRAVITSAGGNESAAGAMFGKS